MPRKLLSDGLTVKSEGYTPLTTAGKVTNLLRPRLSLTVTGLPLREFIVCFIELIVMPALIILLFLTDLPKLCKK